QAGRRQADRLAVRAAMSAPPIVIGPEEELADAATKMLANRIDSLPVVDEAGHLVGIITTTDIVRHEAAGALERPLSPALRAAEVMTREPAAIQPQENLLDAVAVMVSE